MVFDAYRGEPQEIRYLQWKLRTLCKQNGRQGETIHRLRAELAEVRELNSRIDRGDLRRLERFEISAQEQFARDRERLDRAHEEIKALHDKLIADTAEATT